MFEIRDSHVVVTGGTGFLGSHVARNLANAGATVRALGSGDYDLKRRDEIDRMLDETRPRAVIHLAAVVGGIGANLRAPGRFFYDNAIMGIELLEACRVAKIEKVVVAGTVCAYPKVTSVPFREEDLWSGYPDETNAPYGLAKKMLLVQAEAYRAQYGCNFVSLLPVNLYGPGDNFDLERGHVIPSMIRKFLEASDGGSDTVVFWGDGSPTREFLYVEDAADAFRLALERYDEPDPVNVGAGAEISIHDLARLLAELTGYDGRVVWDASKPNGQPRRGLDTSAARAKFGFEATTDLRSGLERTIAWYRSTFAVRPRDDREAS